MKSKSVRFNENANSCFEIACLDQPELYAQRAEQIENKMRILEESQQYQSHGINLDAIFDCSHEERMVILITLHQDAEEARGLERCINSQHNEQRTFMRKRVIESVLDQQQEQVKTGRPYEERAETLAWTAEERSYQARVFARIVAMVDEQIIKEDFNGCFTRGVRKNSSSSKKLMKMVKRSIGRSNNAKSKPRRQLSATSAIEELNVALHNDMLTKRRR